MSKSGGLEALEAERGGFMPAARTFRAYYAKDSFHFYQTGEYLAKLYDGPSYNAAFEALESKANELRRAEAPNYYLFIVDNNWKAIRSISR